MLPSAAIKVERNNYRTYAAYKENLYLKGVWGTAPIEGEALKLPPTKFL